jgi:hypothetical protein
MNTLTQDLLLENRYWTFWSSDWTKRINVFWLGKTKWNDIIEEMCSHLGNDLIYERQVQLQEPDCLYY